MAIFQLFFFRKCLNYCATFIFSAHLAQFANGSANPAHCTIIHYTPGIYAEGYIVFVFPFVCSFVCSFVRTSFRHVEFASKFCVKVSQVVYFSATTHQKAFIFGP